MTLSFRGRGEQIRERAGQSLSVAERRARRTAAAAKERAGEVAAETAERARQVDAQDIREGLGPARSQATEPETPSTSAELVRRAGDAATLRAPLEGTLNPSPSGPEIESFARIGNSRNRRQSSQEMPEKRGRKMQSGPPEREQDSAMLSADFISLGSNRRERESNDRERDELEMDDPFNLLGGDY